MKTLSPKYLRILQLIAERKRYPEIAGLLNISKECLHAHLWKIRKQTHIEDTRDVIEVREWLEMYQHGAEVEKGPNIPTPAQCAIMERVARGESHKDIALAVRVKPKTLILHLSNGCRRAGIYVKGKARLKELQGYFSKPSTNIDDY